MFSILAWSILLSFIVIAYKNFWSIFSLGADTLRVIDGAYIITRNLTIIALISSIISLIFREIRHSWAIESIFVRRFLPIIRIICIGAVWIVWIFSIFDELSIDTNWLLAWAWIGWVMLAFAGRDIMTNLFGSFSILLGRSFDIGETIRVRTSRWTLYEWIVEEITLNYTKMTNIDGEVVFIPNRTIYTEVVENLSRRRFVSYTYIIPFKKSGSNSSDIKNQLRIIEGKIEEYFPIEIVWDMENPNSNDFVYKLKVKLPEENWEFDRDIREYLVEYIFP
jgi:small-conductance mechanosensitive channel